MSELSEKLQEIKRQKDTYITPNNLRKDVTALGITGTLDIDSELQEIEDELARLTTGSGAVEVSE